MISMKAEHAAEVRIRRRSDVPECEVVVAFPGREISLRLWRPLAYLVPSQMIERHLCLVKIAQSSC